MFPCTWHQWTIDSMLALVTTLQLKRASGHCSHYRRDFYSRLLGLALVWAVGGLGTWTTMAFIAALNKLSSIQPWATCCVYREPRALNFKAQVFTLLKHFQELGVPFLDIPTRRTVARSFFEREGLYEPVTRVQFCLNGMFSMLIRVVHVDAAVRWHYLYEVNHSCEFHSPSNASTVAGRHKHQKCTESCSKIKQPDQVHRNMLNGTYSAF